MRIFLAIAVVLLCSCSTEPQLVGSNPNAVLLGTPARTKCAVEPRFAQPLSVLQLIQPASFGSVRNARTVELIMPEQYHVQYEHYIGKTVRVTCELVEPGACGLPLTCGVVAMQIEP